MKRFIAGTLLGIGLSTAGVMYAQRDREFHPRLSRALESMRDARAYLQEAPHDFGGHKQAALRATDEAIRQVEIASRFEYRR